MVKRRTVRWVVVERLAPRDSCFWYNGGMRTALIGIVAMVVL